VLEAATSTAKLVKTDLNDQTILLPRDKVTVGIAAKSMLAKSKASELQKMEFMMECRKFLVATIQTRSSATAERQRVSYTRLSRLTQ